MNKDIVIKSQYINRIHRIYIEKTDIKQVFKLLEKETFPNIGIKRAAVVSTEDGYEFYYKHRINKAILKNIREQNFKNLNEWISGKSENIKHYGNKFLFVFETEEGREWVYFEPLHLKEDYFGILVLTANENDISPDDHFIFFLLANQISDVFYLDDNLKKSRSLDRLNRKFLKHSKSAVAFIDAGMNISSTNMLFRRIFGIRKNKSTHLSKFIENDVINSMIQNNGRSIAFEYSDRNFEGRIVKARLQGDIRYLLMINDVSEVIRLKERVWQGEKLQELGEISLRIAHEIRNPLQVILGFIQLIKEQEDPEKQKEYASIVENESRHLNELIEDLLRYAKKADVRLEETIPSEIVEEVIASTIRRIKAENIRLEHSCDRFKFMLDKKRFREIVMNILTNAIEKMEIEQKDDSKIIIRLKRTDKGMELKISDNGKPISKNNADRLFNPFFTTKDNGHGLGLSIVKNLVEALNGKISVKSNKKNTSFIMNFLETVNEVSQDE